MITDFLQRLKNVLYRYFIPYGNRWLQTKLVKFKKETPQTNAHMLSCTYSIKVPIIHQEINFQTDICI